MPSIPSALFTFSGVILALVTVLLIFAIYAYLGEARESLAGFWSGDTSFMTEAGLTGLALQIEPGQLYGLRSFLGGSKHDGWLLMQTPDGYICNQKVTVYTCFNHGFFRSLVYESDASIEFSDLEEAPELWTNNSSKLHVRLSPRCGTLAIDSGNELLGLFRKDHTVTSPFSCGSFKDQDTDEE